MWCLIIFDEEEYEDKEMQFNEYDWKAIKRIGTIYDEEKI